MIKLTIFGTLLYPAYQYPVQSLLIAILLVFIADIVKQIISISVEKERAANKPYEEIKEIFNNVSSENYLEDKPKIEVIPVDFKDWDYRSLQHLCKLHGIKANSKRQILEQKLLSIC